MSTGKFLLSEIGFDVTGWFGVFLVFFKCTVPKGIRTIDLSDWFSLGV